MATHLGELVIDHAPADRDASRAQDSGSAAILRADRALWSRFVFAIARVRAARTRSACVSKLRTRSK